MRRIGGVTFDDLLRRAAGLLRPGSRAILGLTGAPASGKTTLAEHLVHALNAAPGPPPATHVPMDGFHLADVELDRHATAEDDPEDDDEEGREGKVPEERRAVAQAHLEVGADHGEEGSHCRVETKVMG